MAIRPGRSSHNHGAGFGGGLSFTSLGTPRRHRGSLTPFLVGISGSPHSRPWRGWIGSLSTLGSAGPSPVAGHQLHDHSLETEGGQLCGPLLLPWVPPGPFVG